MYDVFPTDFLSLHLVFVKKKKNIHVTCIIFEDVIKFFKKWEYSEDFLVAETIMSKNILSKVLYIWKLHFRKITLLWVTHHVRACV